MRNIKILLTLVLLIFSGTSLLYAQSNQINFTNGSSTPMVSGQYANSSSVNDGIMISQYGMDYNLVTGHLASIKVVNPDIVFSSFSYTENDADNTMNVGITVRTSSGNIRTIGYKISSTPPSNETGPFTIFYSSIPSSTNTVSTSTVVMFSTFTDTSGHVQVQTGDNYIQWYAQSDSNPIGNTATFIIKVTVIQNKIIITQPSASALPNPRINATIVSPSTFTKSNITISMYQVSNGSTVSINGSSLETGAVNISSDNLSAVIKYDYSGTPLISGMKYVLTIALFAPGDPGYLSGTSTFTVSSDPIPTLIPYPSPYNPQTGKTMKIQYILADSASSVTINIRDRSGRIIRKLSNQLGSAGINTAEWDGRSFSGDSVANGVYICEIIAKGSKENRRYVSFAVLRK